MSSAQQQSNQELASSKADLASADNSIAEKTTFSSVDEQPSVNDELFNRLHQEFNSTLTVLDQDVNLKKFKSDYEKLFQTFAQARENEVRLLTKLREVHNELVGSSTKMQTAMKMSHSDRITIANLKKEIKKAWQMVEDANERELKSKENVAQLKIEIAELQQTLQQTASTTIGQEQSVNELIRQKEELTKERDIQMNQITQLRAEIADMMEKVRILEAEKVESSQEIHKLKEAIALKKAEADKEMRQRDRLERELKDARLLIDQKNTEIRGKQEAINRSKDDLVKLEALIKDQKITIEKTTKEFEHLQLKMSKLQQDYEDQVLTTNQLLSENQEKNSEIKVRDNELSKIKDELRSISRLKDTLQRKIKILEEERQKAENDRSQLKAMIHAYEKDIEGYKRKFETDQRQIEELSRERDLINRSLQKSSSMTQKQINLVRIHEQTKRNLEQDITSFKDEIGKQRKIIYQLEKERDQHIIEAANVQNQLLENIEVVKFKENEVYEFKKKISDLENKLKQQQGLYETVRSDRNLYSKNLVEAQEEINDMKRKLKIMTHQIEQLKDEIQSKDSALVREHADLVQVEKDKESLKNEIQKLKQQCDMAQQYIQNQQSEEQKLRSLAAEADSERQRQKKEYDSVVQERDILSAQLVRRNDELALLYEKIKIQQSTLNKGEVQYRERLDEIRVLKLEIKRLREELIVLQQDTQGQEGLRNEIVKLQKDIIREKSRVKVLEEELQNPINIHRWRKLEGTDPETHDLLQKIQSLQKRLIGKTEEVVEKELIIQQKEKLYQELKIVLARQPGPEIVEQVNSYQQAIKDKTNQLKAMASELNMYQSQVSEYKGEIEALHREMQMIKKRYFEQKRKQAHVR